MDEGTPHEGIARRDALHTGVLRYVVSTLGTAGVLYGSLLALHVSAYVGFVALLIGLVLEGR